MFFRKKKQHEPIAQVGQYIKVKHDCMNLWGRVESLGRNENGEVLYDTRFTRVGGLHWIEGDRILEVKTLKNGD